MERKYEFTGEEKNFFGRTLYRIRSIRDFGNVRKGALGGWIEKEENLSHDGDCWVGENAWVLGNARVSENALVRGDAIVRGNARVKGNTHVEGNAVVGGNAWIEGNAIVRGDCYVKGDAWVRENAIVKGGAVVRGNAWVEGKAVVGEDACISKNEDYLVVGPIGSRNGFATFYKNKDNGISVSCGCFSGTIEEFLNAVKKTHGANKYASVYKKAVEMVKAQIA